MKKLLYVEKSITFLNLFNFQFSVETMHAQQNKLSSKDWGMHLHCTLLLNSNPAFKGLNLDD